MSSPQTFNPSHCPLCGGDNECQLCAPVAYKGQCWCTHEDMPAELLARVPENLRHRACICRACVEKFRMEKLMAPALSPHATRRAPELS